MEAAYRFFDNDRVTPEKILQPHIKATTERISQCDFVLLVQDTSEMDLTRANQQVEGVGPMDSEVRFGAFIHPMIAFRADGVSLGTVWQKTWSREAIQTSMTPKEKRRQRVKTRIEDKESIRWVEGLRAARDVAAACPDTTCVCVSGRTQSPNRLRTDSVAADHHASDRHAGTDPGRRAGLLCSMAN